MNAAHARVAERVLELRAAFDRSFAEPARLDVAVREEFLAIRLATQAWAIRLSEIAGLFVDKKITRVPGGHAALLGIAGFRGAILPVYDLAIVLGHPREGVASVVATPRWLVVAAAAPVALAFDAFERQLRVRGDAILPQQTGHGLRSYAREFVRTKSFAGPIMHLPSVLEVINAKRAEAAPLEER